MNKTIEYYDQNAESFIEGTIHADMKDCRERFLRFIKPGGKLLDAGCGSGRDSLAFLQEGYEVDAFDASEELCRRASELLGIPVECRTFEELTGSEEYDGIWACASLLHVRETDLPDVLERLKNLLKPEGVLYASFKEGSGEREKDGRFFLDMTEDQCRKVFSEAGFRIIESFLSKDVRNDRQNEGWVNIIARS